MEGNMQRKPNIPPDGLARKRRKSGRPLYRGIIHYTGDKNISNSNGSFIVYTGQYKGVKHFNKKLVIRWETKKPITNGLQAASDVPKEGAGRPILPKPAPTKRDGDKK
ncbi:MAG: hypothetical protein LUB59_03815 [Candidatus Gastranaerophilales bacterium]|nr:hypothetical protein [Candidatus Gastranaerophilales bacterium]